jgi:hypothetical protein
MGLSIFEQLKELGAEEMSHVNGSLLAHLKGTHDLLQEWGNRPALCNAGLYHSVYGTADFRQSLIDLQRREAVAELIGKEAEQIVYLFSACDREYVYAHLLTEHAFDYRDRIQKAACSLPGEAVADLCELTMANELEIARWNPAEFLRQHYDLTQVLARMKPFVSANGVKEFDRVFGKTAG